MIQIVFTVAALMQQVPDRERTIVESPVAALTAALPEGRIVAEVVQDTQPTYRPKGKGTAIFLQISGKKYLKQQHSAVVYIMPANYEDGGVDPTDGKAQSWPARLVATAGKGKVYLWPASSVENWKSMKDDLLDALLEESKP